MNYTYLLRQGSFTRSIAAVTLAAVLLWLSGIPMMIPSARAASLVSVSDTISDSDLGVVADHEIAFTTSTYLPEGGTITITFPAGFDLTGLDSAGADADIASSTTDFTLAGNCLGADQYSFGYVGQVVTFTACAGDGGDLATGTPVVIELGTNATGGTGQITNHATASSYPISIVTNDGAADLDSGTTRIVILDDVTVTAAVDSIFTFVVSGVNVNTAVNGTTTTGTTTATTIPFGTLSPGVVYTMAQDLTVNTNAAEGFVVTVFEDNNLESATGADIDNFIDSDGNGSSTPVAWQSPTGILNVERTYGHWGITTDDTDYFAVADTWAGDILATPRAIYAHTGPVAGATTGEGTTRVGFQIEVTALQEAATDYSNTLTYIATATF